MEKLGGYMGKILRVNLSAETVQDVDLNPEYTERFIGGVGYAARLLYDMIAPRTDALSTENPIFFVAGPMVGSTFPGGTKWGVCSRSPLTGVWGESSASGSWGTEMKHAGYDGILVTEKSKHLVYLAIREGHAEIKKAEHLKDKDTIETAHSIQSDLGESKARIASIGPAGERLVKFASIMSDEERACGRTGLGAVMGSKNLKAVAVRGSMKIPLADEGKVRELSRRAREAVKPPGAPAYTIGRVEGLSRNGTANAVEALEKLGGLPVRNWTKGAFPEAAGITGTEMTKRILARTGTCPLCTTITCWRVVRNADGRLIRGPEYETLAAFGSLCMNDNLETVAKANEMCNRLGMDTISTGSAIAFSMECYQKGILSKNDTEGLNLSWGNSDAILKLVKLIALRKDLGAVLAEGVRRAADRIGNGAERCAMHVKDMELPMHDPRRWWSMALGYATSNRGACHLQGTPMYSEWGFLQPEFGLLEKSRPFEIEGAAATTKFYQDFHSAFTAMGHCLFTIPGVIPFDIVTKAFGAVTGRQVDHWDLLRCGERIWNIKRALNIRLGVSERNDILPRRFLEEPLKEGSAAGKLPPLRDMLREYYAIRGWREGKPTRMKLAELGMAEIAKDIWGEP